MTVVKLNAELDVRRVEYGKKDKKAVLVERLKRDIRWRQRSTADNFVYSNDFMRYLVEFVQGGTLMNLRLLDKEWNGVADALIDEGVRSSEMLVHRGYNLGWCMSDPLKEKNTLVTRVVFLHKVTKVRRHACFYAINLVVVDIPEGVESISAWAFMSCSSLTTVSFPTTLISIREGAFYHCSSLDNIDLLHTNLQKLGRRAFADCYQLKSMTLPDSLQTLGALVFDGCKKLVPSYFYNCYFLDPTTKVVAHLRLRQSEEKFNEHYANWLLST
ncbi:hypothetical protein TL16_g06176 [Triparma laevis f. inornata]|uniref:Uncharacterized protein n=1 Tax=Triparma laevis f. inornata TaxID=1714386 RepID=A0A9W7AKH7_9STRA|nr:hypothetical protein TL16_g06176 [Triparma laevis f. inornata]